MYGKSGVSSASKQKLATSARVIEPASPSITLIMPLGGSRVRPPGRTMQYSRSEPGPLRKRPSWLFLSVNMPFMTVYISILKKKGAWFSLSPAPIEVTTDTRFTPYFFIALMMHAEPSVSIVSPTSLVLPPSAITTPVTSWPSNTLSTSAWLVTVPSTTLSSVIGAPPASPRIGVVTRDLSRTSAVTFSPRAMAWEAASPPTPPVAPKTAMLMRGAGAHAWAGATRASARMRARPSMVRW
mmetsp:Transcript_8059/g.20614  ORF Transcript_8059/g.20614 Transcript_8059/m.20614 type:complete len:240 (+) Transcript_8059:513-1232(+)